MVRAKLVINIKAERSKLLKRKCYPTFDIMKQKEEEYQNDLHQKVAKVEAEQLGIDDLADRVVGAVNTSIRKICSRTQDTKSSR